MGLFSPPSLQGRTIDSIESRRPLLSTTTTTIDPTAPGCQEWPGNKHDDDTNSHYLHDRTTILSLSQGLGTSLGTIQDQIRQETPTLDSTSTPTTSTTIGTRYPGGSVLYEPQQQPPPPARPPLARQPVPILKRSTRMGRSGNEGKGDGSVEMAYVNRTTDRPSSPSWRNTEPFHSSVGATTKVVLG